MMGNPFFMDQSVDSNPLSIGQHICVAQGWMKQAYREGSQVLRN